MIGFRHVVIGIAPLLLSFIVDFAYAAPNTQMMQPAQQAAAPTSAEEFAEMQDVYTSCTGSIRNLYYDCDCVPVKLMDIKHKFEADMINHYYSETQRVYERLRKKDALLTQAYQECTDISKVAMMTYQRCVDWSYTSRDDYESFCQCFSVRYADRFKAYSGNKFYNDANARTDAMTSCNQDPGGPELMKPLQEFKSSPSPFRN